MNGTWKEVAGLVAIAIVAGTISNVMASPKRRLKWIGNMKTMATAPTAPSGAVDGGRADGEPQAIAPGDDGGAAAAIEIDTERAIAEHAAGTVFLDARVSASFYGPDGRIPGARSFAVWEGDIDDKVVNLMSELPPSTRIVTYCTGGDCEDSHLLREKLLAAGFADVLVYRDGFPGWVAAGQPVER